jgi:hypothetical protein
VPSGDGKYFKEEIATNGGNRIIGRSKTPRAGSNPAPGFIYYKEVEALLRRKKKLQNKMVKEEKPIRNPIKNIKPKVGDKIYVGTSLHLSHGIDDVNGGLCTICKVEKGRSAGHDTLFVAVEEHPGHSYNWEYIIENQTKWSRQFGANPGYACPDYDPRFNKGI